MKRLNRSLSAAFAALSLLAACVPTHVDPPPLPAAPEAYKETGIWQPAKPEQAAVPDAWWTLFGDDTLNELENRLIGGNENLKSTVEQVDVATAQYEASRRIMFPTLGAGVTGTKPEDTGDTRRKSASIDLLLSSSWEIDLWGRLREARNAAEAQLQASADDSASARLSTQALLAQTYFSLRTADAQMALLDRTAQAYTRSKELTQVLYEGGMVSRSEVLQAQTQLKTTQVQLTDTGASRATLEHAIAVLLGQPPSAFSLPVVPTLPATPAVPEMIPSTLLERRPDIAAAERRVAAAYAQIGVANTAYYPSVSLSAAAGFAISSLTSAPSFVWSIGPTIQEVIFDSGQRKLGIVQARVAANQARNSYRQAVLTALQEVEDNLVLARQLEQETQLQQEGVDAAKRSADITLIQYQAGFISYLGVVTAQTAALNSESNLLVLRNRNLAAVNQLLKNIAGRWKPIDESRKVTEQESPEAAAAAAAQAQP